MVRRRRSPVQLLAAGLIVAAALVASAVGSARGSSRGGSVSCATYGGGGIPPWGFHASQSFPGGGSGYAHGWGNIDLGAGLISGEICQNVYGGGRPASAIAVRLGPRIIYHTHYAHLWGYPGNLIKAPVKVIASSDRGCKVGTRGHVTMYASYNGVRSDSIQFFLGAGCSDQNRLYHGPQVDAQVPPL
jgi:hypothetical protein